VLPLSAAPVGRGADGVDAMALFGNLMMMMNRAKLQQETALVRGQYVTSSDTLTSTGTY
jgi:hypothetical protein